MKAAVKAAKVPANPSRGRLPVAGLVGKSRGLYQKDQKAWLALDETKRLVKIDVGHRFSRKSAKKLCEERGGRLPGCARSCVDGGKAFGTKVLVLARDEQGHRVVERDRVQHQSDCAWGGLRTWAQGRDLVCEGRVAVSSRRPDPVAEARERRRRAVERRCEARLLVNDGKAFGGDKWIPVLDGDPNKDNEGVGWVQIGDPGRLGKNHREAHGADCTWGGLSQAPHWKGPWICASSTRRSRPRRARAGWDTARFVAFDDAGDNRVARRNPGTKRWLRVTPDGDTDAPAQESGTIAAGSGSGLSCTSSRAASACGARAGAG